MRRSIHGNGCKDCMLEVIADYDDFLIAYKPAGMDFHSDQGEAGFFVLIEQQLNCRLFPVHRLDKVTSGLLLVAKSAAAAADLGETFAKRKVKKLYLAIGTKKPKKKQGAIVGDMERSRRGSWKLLQKKINPAMTQFYSQSLGHGMRLYLLKPLTGKTHQLRVAMKSLGTPILGDALYAGDQSDRTYLHAYSIEFEYGDNVYSAKILPKEGIHFLTPEFQKILTEFGPVDELVWPDIGGTLR